MLTNYNCIYFFFCRWFGSREEIKQMQKSFRLNPTKPNFESKLKHFCQDEKRSQSLLLLWSYCFHWKHDCVLTRLLSDPKAAVKWRAKKEIYVGRRTKKSLLQDWPTFYARLFFVQKFRSKLFCAYILR